MDLFYFFVTPKVAKSLMALKQCIAFKFSAWYTFLYQHSDFFLYYTFIKCFRYNLLHYHGTVLAPVFQ